MSSSPFPLPQALAAPSIEALVDLAAKYRRLTALRAERDRGGEDPTRQTLRQIAAAHPGALRELDTLGATELARRASCCEVAAAGGPREPWMAWIVAYHSLMRAALRLRLRAATSGGEVDVDLDETAASLARESALPVDVVFVATILRPPGGRRSPAVIGWLAERFGEAPQTISNALFPPRRPPPLRLRSASAAARAAARPCGSSRHRDDDADGVTASYSVLVARALALSARIRSLAGTRPTGVEGASVALLAPASAAYVEGLLAAFFAGVTAVPLSPLQTAAELTHVFEDAAPIALLVSDDLAGRVPALRDVRRFALGAEVSAADRPTRLPPLPRADAPALMLYTSGTTGRPKGVVTSHAALGAAVSALEQAWGWRREDRLLHVLPLHHTHGVVVALLGALWAGAEVRFAPFDPNLVWQRLAEVTVFMAVPTIYAKLVEAFETAAPEDRVRFSAHAAGLRLATSGSAALPPSLFHKIEGIAGRPPLERYGMTEIGMALGNPLDGPRVAGAVGRELPDVSVEIIADDGRPCASGEAGELRVRSPQLFLGYHGDPQATARAFDAEGRFRTGDTGVRDGAGVVRLLGRTSTDVLKSGGYKLSALEIEDVLRTHPAIADVAVLGLPDETWGDLVTACVVLRLDTHLDLASLRGWAKELLSPYKIPRALHVMDALPRNQMGKLQKQALKTLLVG